MIDLPVLLDRLTANRQQTLRFLRYLEALVAHEAAARRVPAAEQEAHLLGHDPTGGIGGIGWHLMHIAANEDASFGDTPRAAAWAPFQHGRPHDHPAPPIAEIRAALDTERGELMARSETWNEAMLEELPAARRDAGMSYRQLLDSLAWHEPYHLNQCNEVLRAQFAV